MVFFRMSIGPRLIWQAFFKALKHFFPKKIIIEDYDKAINKGFNKFQKCNMISLV